MWARLAGLLHLGGHVDVSEAERAEKTLQPTHTGNSTIRTAKDGRRQRWQCRQRRGGSSSGGRGGGSGGSSSSPISRKFRVKTIPLFLELRGQQKQTGLAHPLDKLPQTVPWSQDTGRGKKPPSLALELWADDCEFPKTPVGLSCG